MSGGSLPRTGLGAVVSIGGVAGVGQVGVPMPVVIALAGVVLVVAGALMVRIGFRRRRPAGVR